MNKITKYFILLLCLFEIFDVVAQVDTLRAYWNDTDFGDSTLVSSRAFSDKLINYFYSFTDGDEQHFDSLSIAGLGVVLEKAKVNMRTYEFILEFALNGYSAMGRTKVTDYLLNYPKLAEGEVTMEEGLRLDSISEPYQKVRVGALAPDFVGVAIDGKSYDLYHSTAKRILVVFWSTDCEYCHDFLVQIRRNLDLITDFELVTFALADNKDEVAKSVKKMRLPGYHFYDDLRWESKPFLDFHITTTPTVFLLDQEKTIVCKPYDWIDLKDWLNKNR